MRSSRNDLLKFLVVVHSSLLLLPCVKAFAALLAPNSNIGRRACHRGCRLDSSRATSLSARRGGPLAVASRSHDNREDAWDERQEEESSFIATCVPGLSHILAQELQALGCTDVTSTGNAAVRFHANGSTALECLIWARTPHKIMEFLVESPPTLQTRQELHSFVYDQVHVQSLLGNGQGGLLSLAIVSTILNSPKLIPADINHSHYTALTIKNALCDAVRDLRGDRPNVNLDDPDVPLVAVLRGTTAGGAQLSLYRQLHGPGSLHKRGYRPSTIHKAALKESLAAGLLLQAQWHGTCQKARKTGAAPPVLLDPMTGSGTLVLEGMLMAADLAPHLMRIKTSSTTEAAAMQQLPPVLRWRDYSHLRQTAWPNLLRQATQRGKDGIQWLRSSSSRPCIFVNDLHTGALSLLDDSLSIMGMDGGIVDINAGDCADWQPAIPNDKDGEGDDQHWTVVCNPPWGVRLEENVDSSWEALGHFLKQNCPPGRTTAWILSGHAQATKRLGLRRSQSMPVKVGTQDLRWLQYELHNGPTDAEPKRSLRRDEAEEVRPKRRLDNQFTTRERMIGVKRSSRAMTASDKPYRSNRGDKRSGRPSDKSPERKTRPQKKPSQVPASDGNEWLID